MWCKRPESRVKRRSLLAPTISRRREDNLGNLVDTVLLASSQEDRDLLGACREGALEGRKQGAVVVLLDTRFNGVGGAVVTVAGIAQTWDALEIIYDHLVEESAIAELVERDALELCLIQTGDACGITFTYSSGRARERALTAMRRGVKSTLEPGSLTMGEHAVLFMDDDAILVSVPASEIRSARTRCREEAVLADLEAIEGELAESEGAEPEPADENIEQEAVTV